MREVTYYSGGLQRRDVPFWTIKISRSTSKILLCVLYIAHGITQRKGPESCVRSVWHGLRSFSSKKKLLITRLRILVIVVGRRREATEKRLTDQLAFFLKWKGAGFHLYIYPLYLLTLIIDTLFRHFYN